MKEIKEGLRLVLKSAPDGNLTDCNQCFFNDYDDVSGENHCIFSGCCGLDYPLVFAKLSDDENA